MALRCFMLLSFVVLACSLVHAAPPKAEASGAILATLVGKWVRPGGGYVTTIKGVDAEDKLDGMYANPDSLPFSKVRASR